MTMSSQNSDRVLIRASAGTGKTFRLSNHYLSRLLAGAEPDSILATTFTRKAAGEIQERLFERLCEAATSEEKAAELSRHVGQNTSPTEAAAALHQLVRDMHRVRVCTLDAFYAKLATAYSLEFGLPSDWRVFDDVDVLPLKLKAIDDVLTGAESRETVALLHLLNKGETKSRVVSQILSAVDGYYEVFVDAGRKFQPWDRVPKPTFVESGKLADAIETLRQQGPKFPHKSGVKGLAGLVAAAEADEWKVIAVATAVRNATSGNGKFHNKEMSSELIAALTTLATHAGAVMQAELQSQNHATYALLSDFDVAYRARKAESGGLTFTDVTRHIAEAIQKTRPDDIGFRLDGDVDHLLLDEFQDTSLPQWDVLQPLALSTAQKNSGSVFCVGDLKQAIYGWRGGVAAIFDRVQEQLDVATNSMDTSYRSSPVIIETVNQIFGRLPDHGRYTAPDRAAIDAWHARFEQHDAFLKTPGYAEVRVTPTPESSASPFGHDIRRWTARFVRDLHRQHPGRTIGVLTRTNGVASELVAHLRGLGVYASDEGREKLTDSAAVQLICSLFTIAECPHDKAALFHVATSPLTAQSEIHNHQDSAAAAALSLRLRNQLANVGFGATVHQWASLLVNDCGPRDLARLRQLVSLADEYDRSTSPSAGEFLRLIEETKSGDPSASLVRVMTVHQSKGLEFDLVVLTELDAPSYKLERSGYVSARPQPDQPPDRIMRYRNKDELALLPAEVRDVFDAAATAEMSEALCRFYVAVTRAKSALYFLVAPSPDKPSSSESVKFSHLVQSLLCDGKRFEADSVCEHIGESSWDTIQENLDETPANRPAVSIQFALSDQRKLRDLSTSSPSSLAHNDHSQGNIRRHTPTQGNAALRGTLVHRWLEDIEWLETSSELTRDRCLELANWLDVPRKIAEQECDRFLTTLNHDLVTRLLSRQQVEAEAKKTVLQVYRELPFSTLEHPSAGSLDVVDNRLIVGTIDRLVLFGDPATNSRPTAAEIIDWKTDYVKDGEHLSEKVDTYRPQIEAYLAAVSTIFDLPIDAVSGRLAFLSIGRDIVVAPAVATNAFPTEGN